MGIKPETDECAEDKKENDIEDQEDFSDCFESRETEWNCSHN